MKKSNCVMKIAASCLLVTLLSSCGKESNTDNQQISKEIDKPVITSKKNRAENIFLCIAYSRRDGNDIEDITFKEQQRNENYTYLSIIITNKKAYIVDADLSGITKILYESIKASDVKYEWGESVSYEMEDPTGLPAGYMLVGKKLWNRVLPDKLKNGGISETGEVRMKTFSAGDKFETYYHCH